MRARLRRSGLDPPSEWPLRRRDPATILLVDERPEKCTAAAAALREREYHVVAEPSPSRALAVWRLLHKRYDLLVTTAWMQETTGVELARQGLKIQPDLRLLLITDGLAFQRSLSPTPPLALIQQLLDVGCEYSILEEPYLNRALCEHVRELLDRTPSLKRASDRFS